MKVPEKTDQDVFKHWEKEPLLKNISNPHGSESKPWHLVNPKIAGKWMFIPLKLTILGFNPHLHGKSTVSDRPDEILEGLLQAINLRSSLLDELFKPLRITCYANISAHSKSINIHKYISTYHVYKYLPVAIRSLDFLT